MRLNVYAQVALDALTFVFDANYWLPLRGSGAAVGCNRAFCEGLAASFLHPWRQGGNPQKRWELGQAVEQFLVEQSKCK